MQAGQAARGAGTIARRGRLEVLIAIAAVVVIAAVGTMLLVRAVPFTTSGAEDAIPNAGSAVIHDDAGDVNSLTYTLPHGKAGAGSAVIHDDAGDLVR